MEAGHPQQRELPSRADLVAQEVLQLRQIYSTPDSVADKRRKARDRVLKLPGEAARRLTGDVSKRIAGTAPAIEGSLEEVTTLANGVVDSVLEKPQEALATPLNQIEQIYKGRAKAFSDSVGKNSTMAKLVVSQLLDIWEKEESGQHVALLTRRDPSILLDSLITSAMIYSGSKVENSIRDRRVDSSLNLTEAGVALAAGVLATLVRFIGSEGIRGIGDYLVAYELQRDPEGIEERFRRIAEAKIPQK